MKISDYAHYAVLLSPLLKWNTWLRSLPCLSSLTTLTTLFYFTTIKMKCLTTLTTRFFFTDYTSLTTLTTVSFFTTVKMKSVTTLTTLFQFTITKMKIWLRSLHCFTFTTIKMKSLTTLTTLFYFTTTNPRDRTTLTTLLLSLIHQIVFHQKFQCFHIICMCDSNFTV